MALDTPPSRPKTTMRSLIIQALNGMLLLIALLLLLWLANLAIPNQLSALGLPHVVAAVTLIFLATTGSAVGAVFFGRNIFKQRWLDEPLAALSGITLTTNRSLELVSQQLELAEQAIKLIIGHDHARYLVSDIAVYEIEEHTNGEILVLAPDLHYEEQKKYQRVIAQQLLKVDGASYQYIVRADERLSTQVQRIRDSLMALLQTENPAISEEQVRQRFQVRSLSENFPHEVLYGWALYRDTAKDTCLQYLPLSAGGWNIDLQSSEDKSRELIDRVASRFQNLWQSATPV